ncbi:glycosyltransferase family protein [Catalinimonas niigatensis]|uniref:hypothetical protein n=1 Tax=Catalinimonas niigatensis TaxID=1397264 RepID=UPI0026670A43|nr:hypothetical protein [Catalinimonas niigatensis]WPP52618.1 hypothetical protein PZB72_09520 [Catalinimonas niigatensis]
MNKTAFLIICEKGYLEKQSVLLIKSIRKYGDGLSNALIYFFSPRKDHQPSNKTIKTLKELGAIHIIWELNYKYSYYGFGNKPFVVAYAEEHINADIFIFLDSDQITFNEIDLGFLTHFDVGVTPVERKKVGASPNVVDKYLTYWQHLYSLYRINPKSTVRTLVEQQEIYPYFNAGLIITKKNGLFTEWMKIFEDLMSKSLYPEKVTFMDQVSLALAILKLNLKYHVLPSQFNYPLPAHHRLLRENQICDIEQIVTLHYHKIFANNLKEHPLDIFPQEAEKVQWAKAELKSVGIYPANLLKIAFRRWRKLLP